MNTFPRRQMLAWAVSGIGLTYAGIPRFVSGAGPLSPREFQDALVRTPSQTEGPFYPDRLPLDTDNDLIVINQNLTAAVGEITHLTGRVVDINGKPIRNAVVEIWQVDNAGAYLHSGSSNRERRDANFQGFGRFVTSPRGEYYFRTIKPVSYPGRTPHIHFRIAKDNKILLTTQMYIQGHPSNERDGPLQSIRDLKQRESVQVEFAPVEGSKIGELAANFEVVTGWTPGDQ